MAEDPNSFASGGFLRHGLALLAALTEYLKARLELAGLESREAGQHFGIVLGMACGAVLAVVFGYFFACLGVVFLLAWAFGDGHAWIWITLGFAFLHFIGAGLLLWLAKNRLNLPVFEATLHEFKKDQEWLTLKTANWH